MVALHCAVDLVLALIVGFVDLFVGWVLTVFAVALIWWLCGWVCVLWLVVSGCMFMRSLQFGLLFDDWVLLAASVWIVVLRSGHCVCFKGGFCACCFLLAIVGLGC